MLTTGQGAVQLAFNNGKGFIVPKDFKQIGVVGVDAGLVWIGDPCYIIHQDNKKEYAGVLGKDWSGFCDKIDHKNLPTMQQFNYPAGHPGLGVVVSSGIGDGAYPVFAKVGKVKGWGLRVKEIRVKFC